MKFPGIYQIQSKRKPDRIYIGSAVNIHNRWKCHLNDLRNNRHHSKKLQRHYDKYGESDLQFSVLLGCDKVDLIKSEQYFLDIHNPYFNGSMKAGSCLGYKHSDDSRKRMSQSHKGYIPTDIQRKKIGDAHRGRPRSLEVINKIKSTRIANGGYAHSEETKRKISEIQKGKERPKRPNWNHPAWNKGKKGAYSPEYLKKLSDSHKGKKMPEEQRLRMIGKKASEASKLKRKGKAPWNKGKAGIYSDETRQKMSMAKKGKPPWNKGVKYSDEFKQNIIAANRLIATKKNELTLNPN